MSPKSRGRKQRRTAPPPRTTSAVPRPSSSSKSTGDGRGGPRQLDGSPLLVPPAGLRYPQLQRHPQLPVFRVVLGMLLVIMIYLFLVQAVAGLVLAITHRLFQPDLDFGAYRAEALTGARPEGLLATNLGIASFAVICCVVLRWAIGMRPGWLASVVGRVRWGYLFLSAGAAVVVFSLVQAVMLGLAGAQFTPQPQFLAFVIVIVLTSPLQAAAEEVFFRGYLLQALGSLSGTPWLGIIGSSLLFALAHGTQSPALFVDRFGFGLLAGILVMATGGLEAGIGTHVINNVMAFILAGLTSTIAEVRQISEVGWDRAILDVGTFAVIALVCWLLARRMRLQTTTAGSGQT
ncbi:CPBP family intramembrane glutamic endopeptidase [Propionibacteriaceae bacterium Y1685]